jgi:hypothetical protein
MGGGNETESVATELVAPVAESSRANVLTASEKPPKSASGIATEARTK